MTLLTATALGRNDEQPNIEVAVRLCEEMNHDCIKEIVDGLSSLQSDIASDCIKILYEVGARKPELLVLYVDSFIEALSSKNNRMVWGAMKALATITDLDPEGIFSRFDEIYDAFLTGSVITVDNAVTVFAKLCSMDEKYKKRVEPLLLKHLSESRIKNMPQHIERMVVCLNKVNIKRVEEIFESRKDELSASQIKRIQKTLSSIVEQ
ncbi:MAG: hypothetical protein FWG21_01715 [Oscillospiraceae bacterium]|nr:hypothetical protein [Oscillospiraceae bacterium]